VNEHSQAFLTVREELGRFQAQVDARFNAVDARFTALEQRFDARFNAVDARFNTVDTRFTSLEEKMSTQFLWIIGIQVTVLIAVVAAMLSRG
jgi:hypothetical protein